MIAMIVDLENHPFLKIIFLLATKRLGNNQVLGVLRTPEWWGGFFCHQHPGVFMYWEGLLWVSKLATPRSASFFNDPNLTQNCIKLLVSTGGRVQNTYEISSFLCAKTPGTQPFRVGGGSQPTLGVGKPGAAAFSPWCFCRNFLFCNNSFVF